MTETEKKLYDYAVSVDWDYEDLDHYIERILSLDEYELLKGEKECKTEVFIEKYKPKDPVMVTLPIEDYNRLRKLEIKQDIKKLKKELKGL